MSERNNHTSRVVTEGFYEPGNATRYHVMLVQPEEGGDSRVFAWLNAPRGGRCARLSTEGVVHAGYLAEKLNYDNRADLRSLMRWLDAHGVECHLD